MTVSVNVETGRREPALVVPNDALIEFTGDRAFVLAVRDGRAQRAAVARGLRGLALTEVTACAARSPARPRHGGPQWLRVP